MMSATIANVNIYKGNDWVISFSPNVTVTNTNISGWTLSFNVRLRYSLAIILTKTPVITSAAAGLFTVTGAAADTTGAAPPLSTPGDYVYDVARTDSGAQDTLAIGTFTVKPEVTF